MTTANRPTAYAITDALDRALVAAGDPIAELENLNALAADFAGLTGSALDLATKRDGMVRKSYILTPGLAKAAPGAVHIVFTRPIGGADMADADLEFAPQLPPPDPARIAQMMHDEMFEKARRGRKHTGRNAYKNLWRYV